MDIPDYETMMLPILQYLSKNEEKKTKEIKNYIVNYFNISEEETKKLIPSGRAKVINNRVGWACTYLRKAKLIESPERGINKITKSGSEVSKLDIEKIDNNFLKNYKSFREFKEIKNEKNSNNQESVEELDSNLEERTPEEIIGSQSQLLTKSLSKDLLENIMEMDFENFEQLVVDLLLAIGYGGTYEDAGKAIGQTNDGGVDGVINEDIFGLDTIYIQAKRWSNTVPISQVRDFAGALLGKRAYKGVFITTSKFPTSAYEYIEKVENKKIILIDGEKLTQLMIKYNLGVTIKNKIEIKEIDSDYFTT